MNHTVEDQENNEWQYVAPLLRRLKVDGGYLYQCHGNEGAALEFVPDVDLTRYQAHLRDAYNKGYQDGQDDHNRGCTQILEVR